MPQRRLHLVDRLHAVCAGRITAEPAGEPQQDLPCGTAGAGVLTRGRQGRHRRVHALHIAAQRGVGSVVRVRLFNRLLLELRGGAHIAARECVEMRGVGVCIRHGIRDHGLRQLRLARTVLFGADARLLARGLLELLGEPLRALLADALDDPVHLVGGARVLVRIAQLVDRRGQSGDRMRKGRVPLELPRGAHERAELRFGADRAGQVVGVRAHICGHVIMERALVACGALLDCRLGERPLLVAQCGEGGDELGVCAVGSLRAGVGVDGRGQPS